MNRYGKIRNMLCSSILAATVGVSSLAVVPVAAATPLYAPLGDSQCWNTWIQMFGMQIQPKSGLAKEKVAFLPEIDQLFNTPTGQQWYKIATGSWFYGTAYAGADNWFPVPSLTGFDLNGSTGVFRVGMNLYWYATGSVAASALYVPILMDQHLYTGVDPYWENDGLTSCQY
jgi:hypothetical protein